VIPTLGVSDDDLWFCTEMLLLDIISSDIDDSAEVLIQYQVCPFAWQRGLAGLHISGGRTLEISKNRGKSSCETVFLKANINENSKNH